MYFQRSAKKLRLMYLQIILRKHSKRLLKARGNMVVQNYHCKKLLEFSLQLQNLEILMQEEANIKAAKNIISQFEKNTPNLVSGQREN